ncbi:MAG: Na/Pi cotransporter family protein, partial [Firmicutes bacterium]|nr:Na/Pi cotransporter family protein [Bacillota bacterium]
MISLLGGLAMFLYGMRLMGDSLKENSSGTLKNAMGKVTDNPVKAFILGVLITALIQSSTATIVITSGLVGAGILTMHQALGIIIGANLGTTVTGQIIRLLDLNASANNPLRFFQPSTLAPLALVIGMVLIMGNFFKNSRSIGNIAIGFGVLFSGLLNMTAAVNTLAESDMVLNLFANLGDKPVLGYFTGAGVAFALQSSSATIGILQAFSATGMLQFKAIYTIICGVYLGDCVTTAIVCSIGANADSRRVGVINILYNLCKTVIVLVAVNILHAAGLLDFIWERTVNSGIIANTNSLFNLCCALILLPAVGLLEKLSYRIIKEEPEEEDPYQKELEGLNPVFFKSPAIALQSCYNTLLTVFDLARLNIERAFHLLADYDEKLKNEMYRTEDDIDRLCDALSNYMVQLQPYIQLDYTAAILNQYYKVVTDFERMGDHAINL